MARVVTQIAGKGRDGRIGRLVIPMEVRRVVLLATRPVTHSTVRARERLAHLQRAGNSPEFRSVSKVLEKAFSEW